MSGKRRATALPLTAAVILSAALFSCSDGAPAGAADTTAAVTSAATETETEKLLPNLPDSDFEGYTFTFAHWDIAEWGKLCCDIANEESDGELINDSVVAAQ